MAARARRPAGRPAAARRADVADAAPRRARARRRRRRPLRDRRPPGGRPRRPLHRRAAARRAGAGTPTVCAVNKIDRLRVPQVAAVLSAVEKLGVADEIFPVSAKTGQGVEALVEGLVELLPESPLLYPPEQRSDASREQHLAELIREQVLRRTREEIPHAVEVVVEEVSERDDGLVEVRAEVWVETESQKGILIGRGGQDGARDRHRGAPRARARARIEGLSRPPGERAATLAPRRGTARPSRHRVACCAL